MTTPETEERPKVAREGLSPAQSSYAKMAEMLRHAESRLDVALAKRFPTDYFIRVALEEMQSNPGILTCEPASIMLSLMHAAALGLPPVGPLGLAYLVPYKGKCTLQVGYRGYQELARRAAGVEITADLVYKSDAIAIERGTEPSIVHHPDLDAVHTGDTLEGVRLAYAVAHFPDGRTKFEYMGIEEIERIRDRVIAQRGSGVVWGTDPAEMARKTVVRRLAKYLPQQGELMHLATLENTVDERGEMPGTIPGEATVMGEADPTPPNRREQLAATLAEKANGDSEPAQEPEWWPTWVERRDVAMEAGVNAVDFAFSLRAASPPANVARLDELVLAWVGTHDGDPLAAIDAVLQSAADHMDERTAEPEGSEA